MPMAPAATITDAVQRRWLNTPFSALEADQLYALLQLRQDVFVVEQTCVYRDLDGLDRDSWHMRYLEGDTVLAYQRCLPPGLAYPESSLGRILVAPATRGTGLGRELVLRGIEFNRQQWPQADISIGAQAYLEDFYGSLGFVSEGVPYPEDGILHIHMRLRFS
ncbi:MAG: GNAT family N-acetyltransferase [Haliea sp.]|uniref:GNAT family N-acetyltransferase n=1 Tax=Haliea sp. TaxID=1932666 RepID=UPI0032F07CC6